MFWAAGPGLTFRPVGGVRALSFSALNPGQLLALKRWWGRRDWNHRNRRGALGARLRACNFNWATVAANRIDLGWCLAGNIPIHGDVGGSRVWQASAPRARLLEGRKNAGLIWR
jgi:hypothetical protein